jgi:hypothetical protein
MEDNAMPKRILKGRLYSKRRKRRPRMRWLEDVESDLKKMEMKGWREKIRAREQWRLVVEEAKAYPGLLCQERRRRRTSEKSCVQMHRVYCVSIENIFEYVRCS